MLQDRFRCRYRLDLQHRWQLTYRGSFGGTTEVSDTIAINLGAIIANYRGPYSPWRPIWLDQGTYREWYRDPKYDSR